MPHSGHSVEVILQPGDCFVGTGKHVLRTLLGSCVSITLWHPELHVGAMSHFLLPSRGTPMSTAPDGRYGDEAMHLMLRGLQRYGARPEECVAKLFGGANMFPLHADAGAMPVGKKNGEAARALVRSHGIIIASEDLFGSGHRQIVFHVHSGDVWARQTHPTRAP